MSSMVLLAIPNPLQREAIDEESCPAVFALEKKSTAKEGDGSNYHRKLQGQASFEGARE